MNNINPTQLLKEYFNKSLLLELSTKTIDDNFGENLSLNIANHCFTDPFHVEEQTDQNQIEFYNKLSGENWTTIKWRVYKTSNCQLSVDETNKDEIVPNALSQLYLQLTIPLFENLIVLLKKYLGCKTNNSFEIINGFHTAFGTQLNELDKNKVAHKFPTILLLHNLRLFRNAIIHSNGSVSDLEKKFDRYNKKIKENNKAYRDVKNLGGLSKTLFYYSFTKDCSKIFLDRKSFKGLTDFFCQIAYVAYLSCCKKCNHLIEI